MTGANRGIGFEVCRQLGGRGLRIVLTARDAVLEDLFLCPLRVTHQLHHPLPLLFFDANHQDFAVRAIEDGPWSNHAYT